LIAHEAHFVFRFLFFFSGSLRWGFTHSRSIRDP